jgi:prevent-host-death family protein
MPLTTLTSREFNQDTSRAKKAASEGPVIITDRGQPAHVLLSFKQYLELSGGRGNIFDQLSMPGIEDIEFDPPAITSELHRPADLS